METKGRTINLKKENQGGGGGGTSNYNLLTNRPQINNIVLSSNKTSADLNLQDKLTDEQIQAINSIDNKQDKLTDKQLETINSGVTAENINQIEINKNNIDNKQDKLDTIQLEAINSTITLAKTNQIESNKNNITMLDTNKQQKLDETLETTNKTVVGAINEINDKTKSLSSIVRIEVVETEPENPVNNTQYYIGTENPYVVKLYTNDTWYEMGSSDVDLSELKKYIKKDNFSETLNITINNSLEISEAKDSDILPVIESEDNTQIKKVKAEGILNYIKGRITSIFMPVGTIYQTTDADFNPSTVWGGTWEKIQGRFLLGASTSYNIGSTGGEATHTLTTNEMPSHTHSMASGGSHSHSMSFRVTNKSGKDTMTVLSSSENRSSYSLNTSSSGSHSHTLYSTGGGASHNNMPPYIAVNIWKRTN